MLSTAAKKSCKRRPGYEATTYIHASCDMKEYRNYIQGRPGGVAAQPIKSSKQLYITVHLPWEDKYSIPYLKPPSLSNGLLMGLCCGLFTLPDPLHAPHFSPVGRIFLRGACGGSQTLGTSLA